VPPEEATSRTLPHLPGKSLEGTLARAFHPMMGPGASHPGSCGAPGDTIEKHKVSLLNSTGTNISAIPFSSGPSSSKKITIQGISGQPLEFHWAFSLLLGGFPLLSLLFNCPKNPYSSARARSSIKIGGCSSFYPWGSTFASPDREPSRSHSVDRWTHHRTGRNSCTSPNSSQGPLLVSPSKTISFKTRS
jgi:hypothetical protein